MRRWLVLLVVVAGCRSAASPAPTTTTTPAPVPSTSTTVPATTTTTDPFAVPAVIDLAYVQRVLDTIYRFADQATRHAYDRKVPDAEVDARLVAIFGGPALDEARSVLKSGVADGFVRFTDPPGSVKVAAVGIVQTTPTCMVVRAQLDFGPYYKDVRPPDPSAYVQMQRAVVQVFNPTGWGVVVAGRPDPGTNVEVC